MLNEFIDFLKSQVGQAYVWGRSGQTVTPKTYEAFIDRYEKDTGGYSDSLSYAQAAKDYCKKQFEKGATELKTYDCSGLGCCFLIANKLFKQRTNSNTMLQRCKVSTDSPKRGWWVFVKKGKSATHIGYMISDTELIEAKGRKYGVAVTPFKASSWDVWGIPEVFADEIEQDTPQPQPLGKPYAVKVNGGSVYIRNSDGINGQKLGIAHRNETYAFTHIAESGWYGILYNGIQGYISYKYTEILYE